MTTLLSLLCFLSLLSNPSSSQSQPTEFTYTAFNQSDRNITLSDSSVIQRNGILQLTNETTKIMGHAFTTSPLQFKNSSNGSVFSFSTCFAIAIVVGVEPGSDGMAFALSSTRDFQSALHSRWLGLFNISDERNSSRHLFAVEFDTSQNMDGNDIDGNHVGIDLNSLESIEAASAAYYNTDMRRQELKLGGGKPILVWIDYDSVSTQINVTISPSSTKPTLPLISYKYDLSPLLQERMYVGFSAATGGLTSSHYVLGWSFKINGVANTLSLDSLPSLPVPKKEQTTLKIAGILVSSFLFLTVILSSLYLRWKIKNKEVIEDWELEIGPHRYSYQELKQATNGFSDNDLLGAGGFGRVYKGTIPSSKAQVAVKHISNNSRQGLREFVSEIVSIGKLRHRNLVHLLGWCRRQDDLLLVYEFMPNGSLDTFLFGKQEMVLSWKQRLNIIKGVASALFYLHEGYEQVVIHRDIKASNVLLDSELNGRLGDFGLAKLCEHGANPGTTRVVGTFGYLAPEFSRTGKASTKSDVFAFGTLLLEVVCGRRPIELDATEEEFVLVDWVWDLWKEGDAVMAVDPKLKGEFDESEIVTVLKLGLVCAFDIPKERPSMRQVMRYLDGEVPIPNDLRPLLERNGGGSMGDGGGEWFDGYVNSFLSSASFEKGSSSSVRRGDVDASYGSISVSSTKDGR